MGSIRDSPAPSPPPDEIITQWNGMIDSNFALTIRKTFNLPDDDDYIYRAESFAMTLSEVQKQLETGHLKYTYQSHHGEVLQVPDTDIQAYTTLFASTSSPSKALTTFTSNARKLSPRASVSAYLSTQRYIDPALQIQTPKLKTPHQNPYYDIWSWTCHATEFAGPLPTKDYADPRAAKMTHPILPVLYHHFGCACPSWEALNVIAQLVSRTEKSGAATAAAGDGMKKKNQLQKRAGVLEIASGNGYWTYLLRRLNVSVLAVDNLSASWRTTWIPDTIPTNGLTYLQNPLNNGGADRVLLLVYMVTAGTFTRDVLKAYKGDTVVMVGTMNSNRYTGWKDCGVEEFFEREMKGWRLGVRLPLPSFAGKDEGIFVFLKR